MQDAFRSLRRNSFNLTLVAELPEVTISNHKREPLSKIRPEFVLLTSTTIIVAYFNSTHFCKLCSMLSQ